MGRSMYMGPSLGASWEIDVRLREIGEFVGPRGSGISDAARAYRWATCLHEAGHVLAAKAYGIRVEKVVVGHGPATTPEWDGYVRTEGGTPWSKAVLNVCGRAAERYF